MKPDKESRKQVRLHFQKGMVVLHAADVPPLACALEDLSTGGCRCLVPLKAVGEKLVSVWKEHLETGMPLQAEINVPPHLSRAEFDGRIAHAHPIGDLAIDVGISFENLKPAQERSISGAMISFSADRLRGDKRPMLSFEQAPAEEEKSVRSEPTSLKGLRLGEILVRMGKLTKAQVNAANKQATKEKLGRYLLHAGLISPADLCHALSLQSGLPMVDLSDREIPGELRGAFKYLEMLRLECIPYQESRDIICVAAARPLRVEDINRLERYSRKHLLVFLGQEDLIHDMLFKIKPRTVHKARRYARYRAALPLYFQFCSPNGSPLEETLHQGASLDISEGGFQVEGEATKLCAPEEVVRRGLCVRLAVRLEGQEMHAVCAVRFVKVFAKQAEHIYPWVYGFQIQRISEDDRVMLRDICIRAGIVMKRDKVVRFT